MSHPRTQNCVRADTATDPADSPASPGRGPPSQPPRRCSRGSFRSQTKSTGRPFRALAGHRGCSAQERGSSCRFLHQERGFNALGAQGTRRYAETSPPTSRPLPPDGCLSHNSPGPASCSGSRPAGPLVPGGWAAASKVVPLRVTPVPRLLGEQMAGVLATLGVTL